MSEPQWTCADHTEMPTEYLGWHAHADWLKSHGYRQRKCGGCGLWKIVLAKDGRLVHSSFHELKSGKQA